MQVLPQQEGQFQSIFFLAATLTAKIMRNFSRNALILKVDSLGENNRNVTVFTPDDGIFHGILYGGAKSKLRSLVSSMNSGVLYLYRDEIKNSTKITDFDVKKYHLSFRNNLFKAWASSLIAEILIKTRAAGSAPQSFAIANGFLDGMEMSEENESRLGLIRFIWRYLDILGICPNTNFCSHCSVSFHSRKFTGNSLSYRYIFDEQESGFICPDCSQNQDKYKFALGKPAITYLESIKTLPPKEVRKIIIDEKTFIEMKELSYYLIEKACDSRLKTFETGTGIL